MSYTIAAILPVYNESLRLHHLRATLMMLIELQLDLQSLFKVYFINDGSTDNTADDISLLIQDFRSEVAHIEQIQLPQNTQKAGVYIAAEANILADLYVFLDADNSFLADDVLRIIHLVKQKTDIGIAAKHYSTRPTFARRMLTFFNKWLIGAVISKEISETQAGLKVFRAESLSAIIPYITSADGFAADFKLLYYAYKQGWRIAQVPVSVKFRAGSHIQPLRDAIRYLTVVARLIVREQRSRQSTNVILPEADPRHSILVLSWRDVRSPRMGGAEVFTHSAFRNLPANKYRIIHLSPEIAGQPAEEVIDGITYLRAGNVLTVIMKAWRFYRRNYALIDIVVDQCNTHRFLSPLWVPSERRVFFIHQLTREIWFYHLPFPANWIGYWTEILLLWLQRHDRTLTVSNSTRTDLTKIGFAPKRVWVIPEGGNSNSIMDPSTSFPFKQNHVFISVGRISPYKGIEDAIKAFVLLKHNYPASQFWIVGRFESKHMQARLYALFAACGLRVKLRDTADTDVVIWDYVDETQKRQLMSQARALVFPAVREGWGLTITEAACVGTPSIVYNAPGVIDAVDNGRAGMVVDTNTVDGLVNVMRRCIEDPDWYETIQHAAYAFSKQFVWERTATVLDQVLTQILAEQRRAGQQFQ